MHQINLSIRYIYLTENTGFGGLEFDGLYQNSGQVDGNADAGISRVQTGDESHIFFYAVLLIASAFGLLKNRNREEKRKL